MMYQGNAAYQLETQRTWDVPVSRPLSVYEGGAERTRRERASQTSLVGLAAALLVSLAVLGGVRVALTAATVSSLRELDVAQSTVATARETRSQLMVERSVLSSADRIQKIATENYGMVYASDIDTITVDGQGGESEMAEGESVEGAESVDSAAQTDSEM